MLHVRKWMCSSIWKAKEYQNWQWRWAYLDTTTYKEQHEYWSSWNCYVVPQDFVKRVVISSKDFTRSTRKNDYTVSYAGSSNQKYGKVEKFLLYPADSEESIHLAIIQELEIQPCAELENLQFPAEIETITLQRLFFSSWSWRQSRYTSRKHCLQILWYFCSWFMYYLLAWPLPQKL